MGPGPEDRRVSTQPGAVQRADGSQSRPPFGAIRALPRRPRTPVPLALPVVAFALGIAAAETCGLGAPEPGLLAVAFAAAGAIAFVPQRAIAPLLCVAAFAAGVARHRAATRLAPDDISRFLSDVPVLTRLSGRVVSGPAVRPARRLNPFTPIEPPPRTRFLLSAQRLEAGDPPIPVSGLVHVSVATDEPSVRLGEPVRLTGWLFRPARRRNPGGADRAAWLRLEGVHAELSAPGAALVERLASDRGSGWLALLGGARDYARGLLLEPDASGRADDAPELLEALVLGQRSAVSPELNEAFIRTGAMHYLSVSGFHVGVLAVCAWSATRALLRRGVRTAALVTIAVVVSYAALAEPNAPVMRAGIMSVLYCAARLTGRPANGLNWLALSAFCLLVCNPLELFRPGFQLSFLQVLVLITLVPRLYRAATRRGAPGDVPAPDAEPRTTTALAARLAWRCLLGAAIVSLCAWAASLPAVLHHFGRFAPFGALQSLLLAPLVALVIVVGYLALAVAPWIGPPGRAIDWLLWRLTDWLLGAVRALAELPGAVIDTRQPPVALTVATYLTLVAAYILATTRAVSAAPPADLRPPPTPPGAARSGRTLAAALLALVLTVWAGWVWLPLWRFGEPPFEVHVLDVGHGSAAAVVTPKRRAIVVDCGTLENRDVGREVARALRALGARSPEVVSVSHANLDHYSGVPSLLEWARGAGLAVSPDFQRQRAVDATVRRWFELLPRDARVGGALSAGMTFDPGAALRDCGAALQVLWPPAGLDAAWSQNNRSLVLRLVVRGRSILFTGDIERLAMEALLIAAAERRLDLRADVLLAPHHGGVEAGTSERFYAAVRPAFVLVSSGREHSKLSALLRATLGPSCRLLSTRDCGAIRVRIDARGGLSVDAPFAPAPVGPSASADPSGALPPATDAR